MATTTPQRGGAFLPVLFVLGAALVVLGGGVGIWWMNATESAKNTSNETPQPTEPGKPIEVGGRALFAGWPKEKPDLVLLVSGQTFGYLSPCGCSRPQLGGLERRYNLVQSLKEKGWDVIGLDVGEVAPAPGKLLAEQGLKKYAYALKAMKEMGYVAVGLGKTEFQNDLMQLLGQFTVNNPNERPILLAGNLVGGVARDPKDKTKITKATVREEYFKVPGSRPMVEDIEIVRDRGVSVGVMGLIGPTVAKSVVEVDASYDVEANSDRLPAMLKKLKADKANPELKVLLYQGTTFEAKQIAQAHPEIQLIVCSSDESEALPPVLSVGFPEKNPTAQIVQVGHKGQHVGLVGVFKTEKGLDLRYQLVPLGEELLTPEKPAELAASHKLLQLLEKYTGEVKADDLLSLSVKKRGQHAAQVLNMADDLKYIGAEACAKCHANEFKKWSETKHSHAYEALEKLAKRPGQRQFDPECVTCHTTGFEYSTGFESAAKTKNLLNNGCENCHGPGSGHAAKPTDATLLKSLAPWKANKDDKLPDLKFLEKMALIPENERGKVQIEAKQQRLVNAIASQLCTKCHDLDNDPKFDIWTYLPKIYHSNLKGADLPMGIGK